MEKVLQKLYGKIKTKEDLNFYLGEINSAKELLFRSDQASLQKRKENRLLSELDQILTQTEDKREGLEKEKVSLEEEKEELIRRESELSSQKKEIRELMREISDEEKRRVLIRKNREVEEERRKVEEEIWNKEEAVASLEKKLKEAEKNGFSEKSGGPERPEEKRALLEKLEEELLKIPVMKMKIAFRPREETVDRISRWIEDNLERKIVLDIGTDPEIMTGAVLELGGKWIDLSSEKRLDKIDIEIPKEEIRYGK